jgi:hypothetical protein
MIEGPGPAVRATLLTTGTPEMVVLEELVLPPPQAMKKIKVQTTLASNRQRSVFFI